MSNKSKINFNYKLSYKIRLNKGKLNKANTEFDCLKSKLIRYEDNYIEDDREEILSKINIKLDRKVQEINKLNIEKKELDDLLIKFNNGDMDKDFELQDIKEIQDREEKKIQKNFKKEFVNNKNKELSKDYYSKNILTTRKDKYLKKNLLLEYESYVQKSLTLPKCYKNKLKKMTNNNAYLWKKIYFYGELPTPENDNSRTIYKLLSDKTIIYNKDNQGNRTTQIKYKKDKIVNIKYNKNHSFSFKNI